MLPHHTFNDISNFPSSFPLPPSSSSFFLPPFRFPSSFIYKPQNIKESPPTEKKNSVKGSWTEEEDEIVKRLVLKNGPRNWSSVARFVPGRAGKQCRERWHNHLNPDIKREKWTEEEDKVIIEMHKLFGNKWAIISKFLKGRTDNSIKNHWNSTIKRKYFSKGGVESSTSELNDLSEPSIKKKIKNEYSFSHNSQENEDSTSLKKKLLFEEKFQQNIYIVVPDKGKIPNDLSAEQILKKINENIKEYIQHEPINTIEKISNDFSLPKGLMSILNEEIQRELSRENRRISKLVAK